METESRDIKAALDKAKDKNITPTVSGVLQDGTIVEMVYRPEERRTLLCIAKRRKSVMRPVSWTMANGSCRIPPKTIS